MHDCLSMILQAVDCHIYEVTSEMQLVFQIVELVMQGGAGGQSVGQIFFSNTIRMQE